MNRTAKIYLVLLVICVLLGVQLALFSGDNFREDEAWVVHGALQHTPSGIVQWTAAGVHPPGWLLIADAWIGLLGPDETITRFLSTLFTALTLAFTFRLGRTLVGYWGGVVSVLILGTVPFVVFYSHELRPYALLLATAAGMQVTLLAYLRRPAFRPALLYVILGILGVYTHYFAAYVVMAQAVFVILFVRWDRVRYLRVFGLFTAIALSLAGWLLPLLQSFTLTYEGGIYYALPSNLDGLRIIHDALQIQPAAAGIFITLLALITPAALIAGMKETVRPDIFRPNWRKWYPLVIVAGIVVISLTLNLFIKNVTTRNLIILMPSLAVIGAMGIFALPVRARWLMVMLIPLVSLVSYERLHPTLPYREMTAFMAETYQSDSAIITEVNPAWRWLLTIPYYFMDRLPGGVEEAHMAHLVMPDDLSTFYQTNPDIPDSLENILSRPADLDALDTITGDVEQLWFVQAGESTRLHDPAIDIIRRDFVPGRSGIWAEPYPLTYTITEYLRLPAEAAPMFRFGDDFTVQSWTLQDDVNVAACASVRVESWWTLAQTTTTDYSLTLVIANQDGQGIAQQDGPPSAIDTSQWNPDWIYRDVRAVTLPCDVPAGAYNLLLGMYDPLTRDDLNATYPDQSEIGSRVYLTTLQVNAP